MATLHESWHAVADLRPRLHPAATVTAAPSRGRLWRVVLHPGGEPPRRISPAAWGFAGLLDGSRTIDRAWRAALRGHGDDALTQPEALDLLGWLAASSLLRFDADADVGPLLRRAGERRRREAAARLMNPLFLRVPLGSPDRLLERLRPAGERVFTRIGLLVWSLAVLAGVATLISNAGRLSNDLRGVGEGGAAGVALATAGVFVAMKLLHELAHGLAAKTLGRPHGAGEVRACGLQWMLVAPVPFVDVTPSWGIPGRWHRAAVGAAGMASDLLIASVAAVLWANLTLGPARLVCLQAIVVATVGTLLFNANPLVRFDGYFILCDLLDAPNLGRRAFGYVGHLVKRFAFGIAGSLDPSHDAAERPWLVAYALAAAAYRCVLCFAIVVMLAAWWPVAAAVLGTATVTAWLGVPAVKGLKFLAASPELHRRRGWAWATVGVTAAALGVAVGVVPVEERLTAYGSVVGDEATLHAPAQGRVVAVAAAGTTVAAGDVLLRLDADELDAEILRERAAERAAAVKRRAAEDAGDAAAAGRFADEAALRRHRLTTLRDRRKAMTVVAAHTGVWLPAEAATVGSFRRAADPLGRLVSSAGARVEATVDEHVGPRLTVGQAAQVVGLDGRRHATTLATIGGDAVHAGRFRVRSPLPAGEALPVGSGVRLDLPTGRRPLAARWLSSLRRHLTPRDDL